MPAAVHTLNPHLGGIVHPQADQAVGRAERTEHRRRTDAADLGAMGIIGGTVLLARPAVVCHVAGGLRLLGQKAELRVRPAV